MSCVVKLLGVSVAHTSSSSVIETHVIILFVRKHSKRVAAFITVAEPFVWWHGLASCHNTLHACRLKLPVLTSGEIRNIRRIL